MPHLPTLNLNKSPMLVFYEVTRACDLVCRHCRAEAQKQSHPHQLSTEMSKQVIDELTRFPQPPMLVFTGGDPFKRDDIFELVEHAASRELTVAMTPSATPLVTREAMTRLKDAGLHRLGLSLDGSDARTHDRFRGWKGSFDRTLEIASDAKALGLSLQVNTTIVPGNVDQLEDVAELVKQMGAVMWAAFFLVPVGRGSQQETLDPAEYEQVFDRLLKLSKQMPYRIKTTEAHHYRRYQLQHRQGAPEHRTSTKTLAADVQGAPVELGDALANMPTVSDGKGVMFISHVGKIYPSGFLPVECGRFPRDRIVDVYQRDPLMQALREPENFDGKCAVCEFRKVCGGSRSRAYAETGNPLASDPACTYRPHVTREVSPC